MKTYLKCPWLNFEGNINPRHFTRALLSEQLGCRRNTTNFSFIYKMHKKNEGHHNITHNRMQKETKENQVKV